uniref:Uncharacterized protein n=1 Tax=Glossina pallidipes TaxID=7398 RepID=A0A1A9ZKI9_GLOPL
MSMPCSSANRDITANKRLPKSGILRLDITKPKRSSGGSVEFRSQPQWFASVLQFCCLIMSRDLHGEDMRDSTKWTQTNKYTFPNSTAPIASYETKFAKLFKNSSEMFLASLKSASIL